MNYPWFRMYSEVLHDKKLARVSFKTRQPKALVLGLWVTILALANDSPERGKLLISDGIPLTIDEILFEAGLNEGDSVIIDEFIQANMLTIEEGVVIVNHWQDRQFASDHSRERVRQYRERQKGKPPVTETEAPVIETEEEQPCNVTVTAQESESDKEVLPKGNSGKPPEILEDSGNQPISEPESKGNAKETTDKLGADTPESRLLFAKINQNRAAKGRNNLKRFASLEQKQKCMGAAKRLGYTKFSEGIETALANGVEVELKALVNWIAKYTGNGNGSHSTGPATPAKPAYSSPEEEIAAFRARQKGQASV